MIAIIVPLFIALYQMDSKKKVIVASVLIVSIGFVFPVIYYGIKYELSSFPLYNNQSY